MNSAFSWQNPISLCPAAFCIPRPNLPVTPGISWLPTLAFQPPIMKRISFGDVSSRRSSRYSSVQSIQSLNRVQFFATPWIAALQASLSNTNSRSLLKLMSIESVMPSNSIILCYPLLLPSIFPSIRVFSNESVLHIRWPKYWSFSFSISPFSEYSGLISFRIVWFNLLALQGTLKSLLQHHSLKASILRCSA